MERSFPRQGETERNGFRLSDCYGYITTPPIPLTNPHPHDKLPTVNQRPPARLFSPEQIRDRLATVCAPVRAKRGGDSEACKINSGKGIDTCRFVAKTATFRKESSSPAPKK